MPSESTTYHNAARHSQWLPHGQQKREAWASLFLIWSGKRVSNSRPQPWQGCALPTELFPRVLHALCDRYVAGLVPASLSITKTETWSGKRVSNSRPQPWQGCALPTELFPHIFHRVCSSTCCPAYPAKPRIIHIFCPAQDSPKKFSWPHDRQVLATSPSEFHDTHRPSRPSKPS